MVFIYVLICYCCSSTVVSIFTPPRFPAPPISISHTWTYPFGFVHVSFIHVPWWPFPYFSPVSLSSIPSGYCQFVYFKILMFVIVCIQQVFAAALSILSSRLLLFLILMPVHLQFRMFGWEVIPYLVKCTITEQFC